MQEQKWLGTGARCLSRLATFPSEHGVSETFARCAQYVFFKTHDSVAKSSLTVAKGMRLRQNTHMNA